MIETSISELAAAINRLADAMGANPVASPVDAPKPVDDAPKPAAEPAAPPPPPLVGVSIDDVRAAMAPLGAEGKEILRRLGATKLSELSPRLYGDAITAAEGAR